MPLSKDMVLKGAFFPSKHFQIYVWRIFQNLTHPLKALCGANVGDFVLNYLIPTLPPLLGQKIGHCCWHLDNSTVILLCKEHAHTCFYTSKKIKFTTI